MATATFSISKNLTILENTTWGVAVSGTAIGNFAEKCTRFSEIILNGTTKQAKKQKYVSILQAAGFSISETEWCENAGFEGKNADVETFRIIFKK